jgi:hypothetical protein
MSAWSGAAMADNHPRGYVYDQRYGHNHYYPPRGYAIRAVPRGAVTVRFGGAPYYFHQGIWYRPYGPHFAVIAPPIGIVVPVLPAFYTTIWWGGSPYYYADDAYYQWRADQHGYVVVDKPDGADNTAATSAPAAAPGHDDAFVYPKNGQSEQQQATDRYECHRWAADQSGFDPTQPAGGVDQGQTADKRVQYKRAEAACLEGRGYTVK